MSTMFPKHKVVSTQMRNLPVLEMALPFPAMVPLPEVGNHISRTALTVVDNRDGSSGIGGGVASNGWQLLLLVLIAQATLGGEMHAPRHVMFTPVERMLAHLLGLLVTVLGRDLCPRLVLLLPEGGDLLGICIPFHHGSARSEGFNENYHLGGSHLKTIGECLVV